MRTSAALLLLVVGLAASAVIDVLPQKRVVEKDVLLKQRNLFRLLIRVSQDTLFPELKEIAVKYVLEDNVSNYRKPEVVERFLEYYRQSQEFLPRGEVFAVSCPQSRQYAQALFDLFYFAKDWDTFYKTAVWSRYFVNEGVFVYALHVAVLHREDTRDFVLPPPYEIYPELYVTGDVIRRAYDAKLEGLGVGTEKPVVIVSNYTGYPEPVTPDQVLSYFTEDVGFNSYFAYLALQYPTYLNKTYYDADLWRRGEFFYYVLQQLFARYSLERLSYNFPEVEPVDYYNDIEVGYAPFITYRNGLGAPVRPSRYSAKSLDRFLSYRVINLERRIRDAIDLGVYYNEAHEEVPFTYEKGLEVLSSLITSVGDANKNYYPGFYKYLLTYFGSFIDPKHAYEAPPSVLEQFETALRDPLFYRIVRRILDIYDQYFRKLAPYTKDYLTVPGVKIESVDVDKLVTYADPFYLDLSNALPVRDSEEGTNLNIRARQKRLNHKPFNYRIEVSSDKSLDALVRVYVGPKYDWLGNELSLDEKRKYFFEIDRFPYQIASGRTVIERNSRDSYLTGTEAPSFRELFRRVNKAIDSGETYYYDENSRQCGFPERLVLPRGSKSGFPLTFYVILTPFNKELTPKVVDPCRVDMRTVFSDGRPLGFPFDRPIKETEFYTQNQYFKDVVVFHKSQEDINSAVQS